MDSDNTKSFCSRCAGSNPGCYICGYYHKEVTGYMCGTDWHHELGQNVHGIEVYRSVKDLKADRNCTEGCGIVKVKVVFQEYIKEEENVSKKRRTKK